MGAAEQDRLVRQFIAGRRTLRSALMEWIRRWFAAASSFRDADADRFVAQAVPVALGAQRSVVALTAAFQARMLSDLTGGAAAAPPVALEWVSGAALRGVDPAEVYRRPFVEIYRRLAEDKSLTEAVTAGQRRAQSIAATDLQLAVVRTSQVVMDDQWAPQFFVRELTGDENCGLCVLASTQRYRRGDLLPIHPGCDCVPRMRPGAAPQVIDPELLAAAHTAIDERFGASDPGGRAPDYRKVILVREHGELGPVLTVRGHEFTGPGDVAS